MDFHCMFMGQVMVVAKPGERHVQDNGRFGRNSQHDWMIPSTEALHGIDSRRRVILTWPR